MEFYSKGRFAHRVANEGDRDFSEEGSGVLDQKAVFQGLEAKPIH